MNFAMTKPSVAMGARPSVSRPSVAMRAASRPSWAPGFDVPAHLDGTMIGDFGFDPLNLGADSYKMGWYRQAELMNGRVAMMAVYGILYQELIGVIGIGGPAAKVAWFEAGAQDYGVPTGTLYGAEFFLAGWAEMRRWQDMQSFGSANADPVFSNNTLSNPEMGYPGIDPLGYAKDPVKFEELKLKEIKNGRLAMLAFAGFAATAFTTGMTPLQALGEHLASPFTTTVWNNDLVRM